MIPLMPPIRLTPRTKDDRAHPVHLYALQPQTDDDAALIDLQMRIEQMVTPGQSLHQRVTLPTLLRLLASVVCMGGAAFASHAVPSIPGFFWFVGAVLVWIAFAAILTAREIERKSAVIVAAFLREGRCPGCGYMLADVPASSDDGRVACPECAAAWNADRITNDLGTPERIHAHVRAVHQPMWMQRLTMPVHRPLIVADAHGRAVHVTDPMVRRLDGPARERVGEVRIGSIRRQLRREHRGRGSGLLFAAAIFGFGGYQLLTTPVGVAGYLGIALSMGKLLLAAVLLWAVLGWVYSVFTGEAALERQRTKRVLTDHALCPGCCEPLENVPLDAAGLSECPACHAAWTIPPASRLRPAPASPPPSPASTASADT